MEHCDICRGDLSQGFRFSGLWYCMKCALILAGADSPFDVHVNISNMKSEPFSYKALMDGRAEFNGELLDTHRFMQSEMWESTQIWADDKGNHYVTPSFKYSNKQQIRRWFSAMIEYPSENLSQD